MEDEVGEAARRTRCCRSDAVDERASSKEGLLLLCVALDDRGSGGLGEGREGYIEGAEVVEYIESGRMLSSTVLVVFGGDIGRDGGCRTFLPVGSRLESALREGVEARSPGAGRVVEPRISASKTIEIDRKRGHTGLGHIHQ